MHARRHEHFAVRDHRGAARALAVECVNPGAAKLFDVGRIDLFQGGVMAVGPIAADRRPVGERRLVGTGQG